ncbi:hypothetical protein GCK72_012375 [Caenorhabditis remanei]|uniref:Delta-like protein n=1 Tax=Caenorhabditis remanei TaxID=31234 RepID=A0A6A5GN11_CAERE|nr:hypothetical protein GCK72_012375 [Caenorhabditis remanei]KAF1755922.1 hypothetical protein GCK72_012375 [Caenorhabditis remanei]
MNHYYSLLFGISFLFLVFSQVKCTGYLEVSFNSDFNLKSVLNVSSLNSSNSRLIPFLLSPNKTEKLAKIPIDFNETVIITVFVINQDRLDIDNATITSTFTPRRGLLSPLTVMYPFTGMKINIGCDTQYYGDQCNVFCCSETASRVGKECNSLGQLGCPVGKKGMDCKQPISKKWCKCKNKGSCISSFGKNLHERIQCSCPVGFTGIQCEKEVPSVEMMSVYGVDPKKFEIGTAKMLYESVVDNEMVEVTRPHSSHLLHNLKINDA